VQRLEVIGWQIGVVAKLVSDLMSKQVSSCVSGAGITSGQRVKTSNGIDKRERCNRPRRGAGLEKSDDSAWDAGSAAGDDAPLTCPLVRPCRRGVDVPPRRADHTINALVTLSTTTTTKLPPTGNTTSNEKLSSVLSGG